MSAPLDGDHTLPAAPVDVCLATLPSGPPPMRAHLPALGPAAPWVRTQVPCRRRRLPGRRRLRPPCTVLRAPSAHVPRTRAARADAAASGSESPPVPATDGARRSTPPPPECPTWEWIDVSQPWYGRAVRWGQTNIREADVDAYDVQWWRAHWRRTAVQGVVVNAGGIVAYYPSEVPLHRQAGTRDLFGEIVAAARADGLAVIARLDSSRAHADAHAAHPEWFCVDGSGAPHREAGGLYTACVNGGWHREVMAAVAREVIARYRPDGFFDNSWSGLSRGRGVCFCPACRLRYGRPLPERADDPEWIRWSYRCRTELWDFYNEVTRGSGGRDCVWIGNNGGDLWGQNASFRDWAALAAHAEVMVLDYQARGGGQPLWSNGEMGKRIRSVLGDKPVLESIAMYQAGGPTFRLTARPAAEARLWAAEAVAGGIRPWWHHVGGIQEDKRQFETAEPFWRWHQANERWLCGPRTPVADVAVGWSQNLLDVYARGDAAGRCEAFHRGTGYALVRARLPYRLVNMDAESSTVASALAGLRALVLPNLAALSAGACDAIRSFVHGGGGLLATFETSLYGEDGRCRDNLALADLFGASWGGGEPEPAGGDHSYLRLRREGLAGAPILPFGGALVPTRPHPGIAPAATVLPSFPVYPPEDAWMRVPETVVPGLYLRDAGAEGPLSGRVAYLPADLDRLCWRHRLPDHADLLARLIRWIMGDAAPAVEVQGPGKVDVHPYRTPEGALVVHLVNLTNPGLWQPPCEELLPVGPQTLLLQGAAASRARLLVAGEEAQTVDLGARGLAVLVPQILDHEVVVVG